jgi:hypothetical protein
LKSKRNIRNKSAIQSCCANNDISTSDPPDAPLHKGCGSKNRLPLNHWRNYVDTSGCVRTITVNKDNMALSTLNADSCIKRDNKWRLIYTEYEKKLMEQSRYRKNTISPYSKSYSGYYELRNKSYDTNLQRLFDISMVRLPTADGQEKYKRRQIFLCSGSKFKNTPIVNHNNPKYQRTGAVSSRNRISAIKRNHISNARPGEAVKTSSTVKYEYYNEDPESREELKNIN